MKMYILMLDEVPDASAPVMAAHSSLMCYDRYRADRFMTEWFYTSFKKVVCRVSREEFNKARKDCDKSVITKESNLDYMECSITFCPRPKEDYPPFFRSLPLWKPSSPKFVTATSY